MSADPLFSVIVPTKDRGDLLRQSVGSILSQTVDDLEVLVVDDGGIGRADLPVDERVHIIARATSGGAAAARNSGLQEARGRYVTFLDDDDVLTPDRLKIALAGLQKAPLALCWKADLATGSRTWTRRLDGNVADTILNAEVPQVGCVALPREMAERFDESFRVSEDVEWWLRMGARGAAYTVTNVGYLMRRHNGPRLTARTADRLDARLRLLSLHVNYFRSHPRAAAYHLRRAAGMAETLGDRDLALRCYLAAARRSPLGRSTWHAARYGINHLTRHSPVKTR